MSKEQPPSVLEYTTHAPPLPNLKRNRALAGFCAGAALGIPISGISFFVFMMSAGAGHGDYKAAAIVLPYWFIEMPFISRSAWFWLICCLQWPLICGAIGSLLLVRRRAWVGILLAAHAMVTALVYAKL